MSDAHKNFAYSTVATAPITATAGTSLVVQAGDGAKFPTPPFNAVVWPAGAQPSTTNAEIVRVTNISTDTLTITRTQESSANISIIVTDQIAANITAKTIKDIEDVANAAYTPGGTDVAVADGGTGSSTASAARTALGLAIGTDVQAHDADLDTWAGKTPPSGTVVGDTDTQTITGKTYRTLNNTPITARNAANNADNKLIGNNASDQTLLGNNAVRATRFVHVTPGVQLVDTDPTNTSTNTVSAQANTSTRAFAILINVGVSSSTTVGRSALVRKTGGGEGNSTLTTASVNQNASGTKCWNQVSVELDSSQQFDWFVSNADVNALTIVLRGYWEYVD